MEPHPTPPEANRRSVPSPKPASLAPLAPIVPRVDPVKKEGPAGAPARTGVRFTRLFSTAGVDPFDTVEWELRDAVITNEKGEIVFEQRGVEIPKSWSQTATNV